MYIIEIFIITSPPEGLRGIVFTRSVCVCVCLSVCVSVCPANILVFIYRLLEEISI